MTLILIVVLLVMVLMCLAILYVLYQAIGVTKKQVSSCFIKELEDYNDYLNERKDEYSKIEQKKEEIEGKIVEMEGVMSALKSSPYYAPKDIKREMFVPTARYIDNEFFDAHKAVNDKLNNIDYKDLIKRLKEKYPYVGNREAYDGACSILEQLTTDVMYRVCNFSPDEQLEIMKSALNESEMKLLSEYLELNEEQDFEILDFQTYLREVKTENDPKMYIRVGNKNLVKESTDDIVYQFDDNISEGIKVIFQNKNYDFSIYRLRSK